MIDFKGKKLTRSSLSKQDHSLYQALSIHNQIDEAVPQMERRQFKGDALTFFNKHYKSKGLTRADFILPITHPDDPVLLEINTLPGLTTHSLVPKIANNCGISYDNLTAKIIHGAIN